MAEEVNSKAPAAGSTANRLGIPSQNRLEDVDIRPDAGTTADPHPRAAGSGDAAFATPPDCGIHLSRYRATICRLGFHETRQAIRTNDRKMSSHLLAQHLRLAQNDERESEDDGRGDHGSELGKYRPESARSELQCLAPCSPTKIFHVGLHVATSCLAYRPATAGARPKGGRSTQGNNSPVNKRTVRHQRKIGAAAWHAAAAARRSTRFAVFPPWLSGLRAGERRALAA